MSKEQFTELINSLEKESKTYSLFYKNGVDLMSYTDSLQAAIMLLGESLFSKQGWDWVTWFCYEANFGKNKKIRAWDKHKKLICYSIDSLHKFLVKEKYIKS